MTYFIELKAIKGEWKGGSETKNRKLTQSSKVRHSVREELATFVPNVWNCENNNNARKMACCLKTMNVANKDNLFCILHAGLRVYVLNPSKFIPICRNV